MVGPESAADAIAAISTLVAYERRILPVAHRELEGWEERAATIPDPVLRDAALAALREKRRNVEATAVFATLSPRAHRAGVLRAIAALQVAIDYLDTLGEAAGGDPLADGLSLHRSICDAVSPGAATGDWYEHHPRSDDGGYLGALVDACRDEVAELRAEWAIPLLARAAARCGEGQSHTHAAARAGGEELEAWARRQRAGPGYLWWEVAAGASSSVAVHALLAVVADRATTAEEAELVDNVYFPPIGALTVLLDDLVDRDEDRETGQHSYLDYCADEQEAASRIGLLADRARAATVDLRDGRGHRVILAGVAGFYLSALARGDRYAEPVRERLLESIGPAARPLMLAIRLRR